MFVVARQLSGAGGEKLNQLTYVQLPFHLCKHFPPTGIAEIAQIDGNDFNRLKVFLGLQHSETGVENVHNCSAAWEIETEREFDLKESERLNQGNLGIEKNIPNIYVIQT